MQPYPNFKDQVQVVECCFLLLNFRRIHQEYEDGNAFLEYNEDGDRDWYIADADDEADAGNHDNNDNHNNNGANTQRELEAWRDGIATALWDDHMLELVHERH